MNTLLLGISLDFGRIHNEHVMLAAIGVSVVFLALLILAIIYTNIPKILNMRVRNLFKKENGRKPEKGEKAEAMNSTMMLQHIQQKFTSLKINQSAKVKLGLAMSALGYDSTARSNVAFYQVVPIKAA